jgi:dTDP-4-amino-4,6-dideoxygalactose transaminase
LLKVPILNLKKQYAALKTELEEAVLRVMASGRYILGPEVEALEKELAAYSHCTLGVGVASGTDALHLSLRALGVGPGDEVVVPAFTFIATSEAVAYTGARPVFADIDAATFNLCPRDLERRITKKTRAIIPVHLYGQAADMDPLMEIAQQHGLMVIEDCAQAIGAEYGGRRVGSFGNTGCFSFYPTKNLGGAGDGGMIVLNNADVHQRLRYLRQYGSKTRYHHQERGFNSRLDELQAAILRVKLSRLEEWNRKRQEIARFYTERLTAAGVQCPPVKAGNLAVFHQYTVRVPQRETVANKMNELGISTMIYYPVPLHLQEVYRPLGYRQGDFPESERAAQEVLSLPIYPELTAEEMEAVVGALLETLKQVGGEVGIKK